RRPGPKAGRTAAGGQVTPPSPRPHGRGLSSRSLTMKVRLIPALVVVALAGCSKVHEQRSFTLEAFSRNTLSISAPLSEQKVKVVVTSDEPVDVWVLLDKEVPPGDKLKFDPET